MLRKLRQHQLHSCGNTSNARLSAKMPPHPRMTKGGGSAVYSLITCSGCSVSPMTLLNKSARKASLTFGNCVSLAGLRTLLCREKRPHCRPRSQSYLLLEADRTAPSPNAVASSSAAMCRLVNLDWSPLAKNTSFLLLRCWTVRHARPEYRQTKPSTKDNVCAV